MSQLALVEKVIYRDGNVQSLCSYSVEIGERKLSPILQSIAALL